MSPDSDSSEDVDMDEPEHNDEPPATQYDIMRDGGFTHLEHEDEDDRRATQRIRLRNTERGRQHRHRHAVEEVGENHVAENGIIESIECINFMCHVRLHCELGPLLNFIVGENGSGKSAILTAITLCLGGKASSTNRGGSLKSFIKEGCDQSVLRVKIKNQGHDAFQPEIYGDCIVVERHFSKTGSSGFKIKSATGRTISTKKGVVEEIVEYYCLQVDNPLNVLSQDNARQFLNAASNATKYKFFVQGVQLQQLDDDYRVIQDYLQSNEVRAGDLETKAANAQKALDKAQQLEQFVKQHESMRQQARLYRRQLIWAQVVDQERALETLNGAVQEADGNIAQAEQIAQEKSQIFDEMEERVRRAQTSLENVKSEEAEYRDKVAAAQQQYATAKGELVSLHQDERDVHQRVKNASDKMKSLEHKIRGEERRLEDANGDAHTRKQNELVAAQSEEAEIDIAIEESNALMPQLEREYANAEKDVKKMNDAIEHKRDEITSTESKITNLEQGGGSPYDGYEPQLPQLLRAIEHDHGFEQKPIGPIGAHVHVLKPVWSSILESTFGGLLNGFIVTNKRDQHRLRQMMTQLKIRSCPIFIGSGHAINTDGREPDPEFDTILRILKIDNQLVRNQLIINNRIEQIILIQDRTKAERVMMDGPAPRNVAACLCLHEKKRGYGLRMTVRTNAREGGMSIGTTPVEPPVNQKARLKSDSGSQVKFLKESLQFLSGELRELDGQKRRITQTIQRCRTEIAEQKKKNNSLKQSLRAIQVKINDIQEELDAFDGADGRLQTLREELELVRTERDQYGDQYGTMHLRKSEMNKQVEDLQKRLTQEKSQLADYEARLHKAEDKVKRSEDTRRLALVEKNQAFEEIDLSKDEKARRERKRDRQIQTVEDFTRQASEHSERVHIGEGETHSTVEKKLESLDKALASYARTIGMTDEQVFDRAAAAKAARDQAVAALEQTRKENQALKRTHMNRLDRWRQFQRYISARSRANFMYLLSERSFRGTLRLDHKKRLLELQVEPDQTKKSGAGRNTKTLSGGEKSFSSICLLLSIWEAMGSPLRCLDEFDVFMDNVNRAISTNMLVSLCLCP